MSTPLATNSTASNAPFTSFDATLVIAAVALTISVFAWWEARRLSNTASKELELHKDDLELHKKELDGEKRVFLLTEHEHTL